MLYTTDPNIPADVIESFTFIIDLMRDFEIELTEECYICREVFTRSYGLEFKTNGLFVSRGITLGTNSLYFWDRKFRGGLDSIGVIVRLPTSKLKDMEFMENVMRLIKENYE